jgi:hypothetical protein
MGYNNPKLSQVVAQMLSFNMWESLKQNMSYESRVEVVVAFINCYYFVVDADVC